MSARELNLDGLVGPTHNYAGLSPGNLLSARHAGSVAHPRAAARQGLAKMRAVADLGLTQLVMPPHPRPDLWSLRQLGYQGSDAAVVQAVAEDDPALLSATCSASGMWTANAATISPSADTEDGRVHMTPANLSTLFHRAIEAHWTTELLRTIFPDSSRFCIHDPLPGAAAFADEGAANHTRFAKGHEHQGVAFFVWGRTGLASTEASQGAAGRGQRFQGRQTREASEAIARQHGLDPNRVVFAQQSSEAIDAGVFHNDVIAVGNEEVLLFHDQAFVETDRVLSELRSKLSDCQGTGTFTPLCVQKEELSLEEASDCYLFNSQLLSLPGSPGAMLLLVPTDCEEHPRARRVLDRLVNEDNPIEKVAFIDVRQSMRNGGGPACLRLRMVLNDEELNSVDQHFVLNETLYDSLCGWVDRNYREELAPADLADPALVVENQRAFEELRAILPLPMERSVSDS